MTFSCVLFLSRCLRDGMSYRPNWRHLDHETLDETRLCVKTFLFVVLLLLLYKIHDDCLDLFLRLFWTTISMRVLYSLCSHFWFGLETNKATITLCIRTRSVFFISKRTGWTFYLLANNKFKERKKEKKEQDSDHSETEIRLTCCRKATKRISKHENHRVNEQASVNATSETHMEVQGNCLPWWKTSPESW